MSNQPVRSNLLTEGEASTYLNIPVKTLQRRRSSRVDTPPFRKLGAGPKAPVRYCTDDLDAWLDGKYNGPLVIVAGGGHGTCVEAANKRTRSPR